MGNYKSFVENIYRYCDSNVGKAVLFPIFPHLWPEGYCNLKKQDLINLTSRIVNELEEKNVLKKVKRENLETSYPWYEILEHEKLVNLL